MQKSKIIIGIIVVALAAIGVYLFVSKDALPSNVIVGEHGEITGKYSIKDIMALNKPVQCTFVMNKDNANVNGAIIVSGQNVRGDFDISLIDGSMASHFIVKDGISYTWTSLANIGFKKQVAKSADSGASPEDQASIVGIQDKVDYSCTPWNEDSTRFFLPTGITFSEIN